jgi:maltose O-acetyltransferase
MYVSLVKNKSNLFKNLLRKTVENFCVKPTFHCDYSYNIYVGENFFTKYDCIILDVCKVTVRDNCRIGPRVSIYIATHPLDAETGITDLEYDKPVIIGNNVWIGGSAVIMNF